MSQPGFPRCGLKGSRPGLIYWSSGTVRAEPSGWVGRLQDHRAINVPLTPVNSGTRRSLTDSPLTWSAL